MCFLQVKKDKTNQVLDIYDIPTRRILYRTNNLQPIALKQYLQTINQTIDGIWIPIDKPYKDTCYEIKTIKSVIIPREEVMCFLNHVMGQDFVSYMEEVAAELEGCSSIEAGDIGSFIMQLYEAKSRDEAIKVYHRWQECMPLDDPLYYKILRTLETYQKEIFNYFN